jgi:hypothetical protein
MDVSQGKEGQIVTFPTSLTHSEFMKPVNNPDKELPFIGPGHIPIHPSVWRSKFAFSEQFVDEVVKRVPQSIKDDLEEARRIYGKNYETEVLDWGQGGWVVQDRSARKGFSIGITSSDLRSRVLILPKRSYLRVKSGIDPEIILDPEGEYAAFIHGDDSYKLGKERLREYNCGSEKEPKALTWWTHKVHDASREDLLVLRNFAFLVNNLGLQRVCGVKNR